MRAPKAQIVSNLEACFPLDKPAILTIGNFDSVHLGHQAVLKHAHLLAQQHQAPFVILTFSNHPSEILRPDKSVIPLCTAEHKYNLLSALGADLIITLTFSHTFADQTPEAFLNTLQSHLPFSHLILGHDARIGKDRLGDRERVLTHAKEHSFVVEYLSPRTLDGEIVSSSRIREFIKTGDLKQAAHLLGRWPSFYGKPLPGRGLGRTMGFPTLNLDVSSLCIPSCGVYAVQCTTPAEQVINGVANLGKAPTVRSDDNILLEVFLFDHIEGIEDQQIEVCLKHYLRPEKKFDNLDQLKQQIATDVQQAKDLLENT